MNIREDKKKVLESLIIVFFCACLFIASSSADSGKELDSGNREIFITVNILGDQEETGNVIHLNSRIYNREIAYICNYLDTKSVLEDEVTEEWGTVTVRMETEQGEWISREFSVDAAQKEVIAYINGIEEGKFKNMGK